MKPVALGVALLPLVWLGCVPLKDLSSNTSDPKGGAGGIDSLQPTPAGSLDSATASTRESPPNTVEMAPTELGNPLDVGLDPTPSAPVSSAKAPSGAPTTVIPPASDAADSCAALGGFTISEASSCYMLGDNVFAWQDARNFCQAWGGDLVEIDSAEENALLVQRIEAGSVWIGATDVEQEGTFRWAGGNLLGYAGWGEGQPNNLMGAENCTELRVFDERWSDVPCTGDVTRRASCEVAASSSANGD